MTDEEAEMHAVLDVMERRIETLEAHVQNPPATTRSPTMTTEDVPVPPIIEGHAPAPETPPAAPSPDRQIMHSFAFEVSAATEAGVNDKIDDRLTLTEDPAGWTIVQKNMEYDPAEGIHAQVICVRVAGYVPWEPPNVAVPVQEGHAH